MQNRHDFVGGWGVEHLYHHPNYLGKKMVSVVYFSCRFFLVCLPMNFQSQSQKHGSITIIYYKILSCAHFEKQNQRSGQIHEQIETSLACIKNECFTSLNLSLNFKYMYTTAPLIMCRILTVSTTCRRPISTGRLSPLGPSLILGLI